MKAIALFLCLILFEDFHKPESQVPRENRHMTLRGSPYDCLGAYFMYHDITYREWESDIDIRHQVDIYVEKYIDFSKEVDSVTFSLYGEESRIPCLIVFWAYGGVMDVEWVE